MKKLKSFQSKFSITKTTNHKFLIKLTDLIIKSIEISNILMSKIRFHPNLILFFIIIICFNGIKGITQCNGKIKNNICCPNVCDSCGQCNGDKTNDEFCCESIILNDKKYCNQNQPPCIIDETNTNTDDSDDKISQVNTYDDKSFFQWLFSYESDEPLSIVKFCLAIFFSIAIFLCCIYICCCFGHKDPPVDYTIIRKVH